MIRIRHRPPTRPSRSCAQVRRVDLPALHVSSGEVSARVVTARMRRHANWNTGGWRELSPQAMGQRPRCGVDESEPVTDPKPELIGVGIDESIVCPDAKLGLCGSGTVNSAAAHSIAGSARGVD